VSLSPNENPFFHRGPIRDRRYFFGRAEETRRALRTLGNGQSISIVGPRRIGKTSLLFHLCDPKVQKKHNLGEEYLFTFINCEGLGDLNKSQFYQWIWQEIKSALAGRGAVDDWTESLADLAKFREMMQTIREMGYRLVLLFDEFEALAQNLNLDHDFFSGLRSLTPAWTIYATASHNSLADLTYADESALSSPFFNIFKPVHLEFLKSKDAREMVLGSLRLAEQESLFTESDLDFVLKIGGCFPFFLQMACDYLFERKLEYNRLTTEDYASVRQDYAKEARAHFRYIWNNLNVKERNAVRLVAEGKGSQLGDGQRRLLESKCVLYDSAVFSSAFAEFVQRQGSQLEVYKPWFGGLKTQIKLQIARLVGLEFEVRAFETPMGEPRANSRLPYDSADLIVVLKALELGQYDPDRFTSAQTEALHRLGLLSNPHLVPDRLPRIGEGLYRALFPDQVGVAFQMAFNQVRSRRETVALQLRFDPDAVALARYPWELLHDGHRHLLSSGMVEMTRYVTYAEAATTLPVAPPWRLLYILARPQNLDKLPDDDEQTAVWESLQSLIDPNKLTLDRLDPPTYDALLDRTNDAVYHIIHFDGHGVFARRCPECATMHYPHITTCQSCAALLDAVPPLGYLAFEDSAGDVDYVSTEAMENVLWGSRVRLVVLSACQSGVVRGGSLFGGLAPGLIRAAVPAVVAMQFSVPVGDAVRFAQGFYLALAQGETLPRAVARGRQRLFRRKTWFIPTLYLRSTDDEEQLFIE